jgi:hypothetical protein
MSSFDQTVPGLGKGKGIRYIFFYAQIHDIIQIVRVKKLIIFALIAKLNNLQTIYSF